MLFCGLSVKSVFLQQIIKYLACFWKLNLRLLSTELSVFLKETIVREQWVWELCGWRNRSSATSSCTFGAHLNQFQKLLEHNSDFKRNLGKNECDGPKLWPTIFLVGFGWLEELHMVGFNCFRLFTILNKLMINWTGESPSG